MLRAVSRLWSPALRALLRPSAEIQRSIDSFIAAHVGGQRMVSMHVRTHLVQGPELKAGERLLSLARRRSSSTVSSCVNSVTTRLTDRSVSLSRSCQVRTLKADREQRFHPIRGDHARADEARDRRCTSRH